MHKYLNANNALISSSRVLVILPTLSEGGAEKFITELLCEISKDSDKPEISLLVLSGARGKRGKHLYDLLEHNNVNVHLFKRYKSRLLLILAYLRLLFKIKPNVILANLFLGEIFGVLSKLILFGNVKLIRRIANKKLNRTLIDKIFCNFFDLTIFCSPSTKDSFLNLNRNFKSPGKVIPNGTSYTKKTLHLHEKTALKDKYELPKDAKILLHVGRMFPERHTDKPVHAQKAHDILIEAFALASKKAY